VQYTAFGKKKKVVEIDFQRLFKRNYLTSVKVVNVILALFKRRHINVF